MSRSSSKFSFSSTFNWEDSNLRALLKPIPFYLQKHNDQDQPFCHYRHKNLAIQMAPFRPQTFRLDLNELTNIKYIQIENYSHGSEMTIGISDKINGPYTEVYQDSYVCKGKTLKKQKKMVDIGALPCLSIEIQVKKGCTISSKNIGLVGVESTEIDRALGEEYFKLLVYNPMKILYI